MASTENAYIGYQAGSQAGGMWGGIGGAIDGYFGGPIFQAHMKRLKDWYTFPQLDELDLADPTAGMDEWLKQVPYQDKLQQVLDLINGKNNAAFRRNLESADPFLMRNARQQGENTNSMLRGELPEDVKSQIARSAAFKSMTGGFGGSPMASNLTARDLGLGSLELMGKGAQGLKEEAAMAQFLTPYNQNALDLFTSAQDLLQRKDRETAYNNQIANQQKALDFASNLATKGDTAMLSGMVGGMGRGGGGAAAPASSSGSGQSVDYAAIANSLAKMYTGGGGNTTTNNFSYSGGGGNTGQPAVQYDNRTGTYSYIPQAEPYYK